MDATADFDGQQAGSPAERGRDYGAWLFMAMVVFSVLCIAVLARNIFAAAHNLELAKRNAELTARTLAEVGVARKAGKAGIAACRSRVEDGVETIWGACWTEIAKGPDMARISNVVEPGNAAFGPTCDGSDEAIGRIIIERGTPWFQAGNTGTVYAPVDADDSIAAETPLRIQVCNRWGEPVKVQEIKF